jgi:protein-disulfide isomerase
MNAPFTLAIPVNGADHAHGHASARATLVEYGDFECPDCGQAYHALDLMLRHFGNDLRLVYRHFPLREVHPHAELAAEAAEAAAGQSRFWDMHKQLYENQLHLKPASLRGYAQRLELDLERYDADMRDHLYLQRVQEHIAGAQQSGVRGTPTFFLNGKLIDASGAGGYERLRSAIEAALKR